MHTILVIESDIHLCRAIIAIIEDTGQQATCAQDEASATKLVKDHTYDLIVCDTTLAGKSTVALLTYIRREARTPNTPIILIAGHLAHNEVKRFLELGVSEYLEKPFTEAELLHKLEYVLAR